METKQRSWVKSIVWRLLGIIILGAITWVITKDIQTTTSVTLIFHTIRLVLYYYHERLWDKIDWGLKKKIDLSDPERREVEDRLKKLGYIE